MLFKTESGESIGTRMIRSTSLQGSLVGGVEGTYSLASVGSKMV